MSRTVHKSPLEIHRTEQIPALPKCFETNTFQLVREPFSYSRGRAATAVVFEGVPAKSGAPSSTTAVATRPDDPSTAGML